ncbi:S-adenosyl-L-methionine-dependent methyltransferase [Hypoxylon sp. FL1284]|nr:S-adenosyl-L-methionine-dependent methyltransferase [Hypoxylon sp. FL1284]
MAARTIEQLSETIANTSAQLSLELKRRGIPSPTVDDIDSRANFDAVDIKASRELVDAARELEALVMGPSKLLRLVGSIYHDASSLGALIEFDMPALVPLDGTATIASLASQSGLSEDKLTRFVRYAATNFIFREPSPGVVAHTAASAAIARDPQFNTLLRWVTVNMATLGPSIPAACKRWPRSERMDECALNHVTGSGDAFYDWASNDAETLDRFNRIMTGHSGERGGPAGRSQQFDVEAYPWAQRLGQNAVVVDVGGGFGHVSRALALANRSFDITVQDRADVIVACQNEPNLPANLTFQTHDFFAPQPACGADAYFLRGILHNWPHAEAVSILRALVPALKPGARVLVSELIMPGAERGDSLLEDKLVRQADLHMMSVFNAKERTEEDYVALFQEADERLKFRANYQTFGDSKRCIFEAVWE